MNNLKKADTDEIRTHCVFRLQRSLTELNGLVDELLLYARMESSGAPLEVEAIDVCAEFASVAEVVADLREDVKTEIVCNSLMVMANARYFKRALLNLVTNAVRHAKQHIWITGCKRENEIEIVVEDDGPGVDRSLREKIFEPFYRGDESRGAYIGGTGLGLAIVRRMMILHGGRVEVGDGAAGGARFVLIFPQQSGEET